MSYYSVAAVFQGDVVFHRDTPLKNGIEGLVIEACSKLMKMSDEVSEMDKKSYVIVEKYWEQYSEPEIELFFDISEVEDILHHEYGAETVGNCGTCLSPIMMDTGVWCNNCGEVWDIGQWDYAAESVTKTKGKVRTLSGKPHKPRKLTQDQGISPEEAAKRIALKSETDSSWSIQNIDTYDTIYGTRIDGKLYNHSTGERAEFTDAEIEPPYVVEDMWDDYDYEDDEEDDDEEDVNCSCDNLDHTRSNVECPLNDEHEILSEIATSKDSEEEAYAYAYNVGHSDGRKREPYKPNPEVKDTADFRKVYKQRAENTWNPKTFESENRVFKSPLDDKTREIL
jgi:hypothetical protein